MTSEDYGYLYGQLTFAEKKLPRHIYEKIMEGEDFTEEEEEIVMEVIRKDKEEFYDRGEG